MRMTFGQHRGKELSEVPDQYLIWALENCRNMPSMLRFAIERHLGVAWSPPPPPPPPPPPRPTAPPVGIPPDELERKIKGWFRSIAMDYHPDRRAGSDREMAALNDAHERLRKALSL